MNFTSKFSITALAFISVACSQNEDGPNPDITNDKGFIRVEFSSVDDSMTRADDDITTSKEGEINDFVLAFYDEHGAFISQASGKADALKEDKNVMEVRLVPLDAAIENRKVVCYVNVGSDFQAPATIGETEIESDYMHGDYFKMSSSVFYSNGEKVVGSPLGSIFATSSEAESASDNQLTKINLERLASKARLTVADEINTALADDELSGINFSFDSWTLTATASKSYLLKQLDESAPVFEGFEGTMAINSDNRTFWSNTLFADNVNTDLKYSKINDARTMLGSGNWEYCHEHALSDPASNINSNTAILLKGHYEKNGASITLYEYNSKIYEEENLLDIVAKDYQIKKGQQFATGSELMGTLDFETTESLSVVKLAIKEGASLEGMTVAGEELNQGSLDNRAVNMPKIRQYRNGTGFYWIPIEHFGKGKDNKIEKGTYGVIRNVAYDVEITGINGKASPIANQEAEVKPEEKESLSNISVEINIYPWKLWKKQQVTLGN